jgi:glycosyltransferase involved in cell wall biosynthesis
LRVDRTASIGAKPVRVLYISYDGALEPLGQSQVLSYIERLASSFDITLLSFEKAWDLADSRRVRSLRDRCAEGGIRWVCLRYHKRPRLLATSVDLVVGTVTGLWLAWRYRIRIAHARGYVASVIGLVLQRVLGLRFLFDMRGFWADERVDAGHWTRNSRIYRVAKRCERQFVESADAIVSLTAAGIEVIRDFGYKVRPTTLLEVIPTCTDLARFAPGPKPAGLAQRLGLAGSVVIGCVGTMSNRYLRRSMLEYLTYLMRTIDGVEGLVVTQEDHALLCEDAIAAGVPRSRFYLTRAGFAEMPEFIRLMDLGLFFIKPELSTKGTVATKLGEFLASGVPVIINDWVGDAGLIVREGRAGVVLPDTSPASFEASIVKVKALLEDRGVAERCRRTAQRWFDLEMGVDKYRRLYERCAAGEP